MAAAESSEGSVSVVKGKLTTQRISEWGDRKIEVGCMTAERDGHTKKAQTTIPCPFCKALLWEPLKGHRKVAGRILAIVGQSGDVVQTIIDPFPKGHRALVCKFCQIAFTLPSEDFAA